MTAADENPLKVIAINWYGKLTPNREVKLERLWRRLVKDVTKPAQGELAL